MKTTIKPGDKIYYLHRSTYAIHDMQQVVLTMNIIKRDGVLTAVSELQPFPKSFAISPETIEMSNNHPRPHFFETRAEAEAQYQGEINKRVQAIHDQPKGELINEMYQLWFHEQRLHAAEAEAMKQKIKGEFGVDVDTY